MMNRHLNRNNAIWALPEIQEVPTVPHPKLQREGKPLHQHPLSILIVDDIPDIRLFMRAGLETFGYRCGEAQHGMQALHELKTCRYDVVVTDLQMPFLDGMGLAQHLQEDPTLGNPMVIMMTASDTNLLAPLAQVFGILDILPKPCDPSDIDRIIQQHQTRAPQAA